MLWPKDLIHVDPSITTLEQTTIESAPSQNEATILTEPVKDHGDDATDVEELLID